MGHTKGKLNMDGYDGRCGLCICDEESNHVFTAVWATENQKANAERLVHCWNSHDALVEALSDAVDMIEFRGCIDCDGSGMYQRTNNPKDVEPCEWCSELKRLSDLLDAEDEK